MLEINHKTQVTKITMVKINDLTQIIIPITRNSINQILFIKQIFSNYIHETNKGKQDITPKSTKQKLFTVTTFQANHYLTIIMPLDNNLPTDITIVENLQIKETHEISHRIDTVDETVKTIDIKIIIQDQIQIEAIIQSSLKTVPVQTLVIDTIQTIDPETPRTKKNRNYSNNRNRQYQNNRSRDYSDNRSNYHRSSYNNYHNRSRDNSQNRNSNYQN